jgi:hypothetical protein
MKLPPPFDERPFWLQVVGGIVVPMVFGIFTGFVLTWHEILYYVLAGPIAIAGGFLAGVEHRGADDGVVRGAIGGLVFGSFILIGLEIMNDEPKAEIPHPQVGLVVFITLVSGGLGALGGGYRARLERRREGTARA